MDAAVAGEVLRVVQPGALEAAVRASCEAAEAYDDVLETLQRDVEAARYTAQRAWKQ